LNLLQLAPGGHMGRFCVWTEAAFAKLDPIYGEKVNVSYNPRPRGGTPKGKKWDTRSGIWVDKTNDQKIMHRIILEPRTGKDAHRRLSSSKESQVDTSNKPTISKAQPHLAAIIVAFRALVKHALGTFPCVYVKGSRMHYSDVLNSFLSILHPDCYHLFLHEENNLIPNGDNKFSLEQHPKMHSASMNLCTLGIFIVHAFTKPKIDVSSTFGRNLRSTLLTLSSCILAELLIDREKDELTAVRKKLLNNVLSAIVNAKNTSIEHGGMTTFDKDEKTEVSAMIFEERAKMVVNWEKMPDKLRLMLGISDKTMELIHSTISAGVNHPNNTQFKVLLCQCVRMYENLVAIEGFTAFEGEISTLRLTGTLKNDADDDNTSCNCKDDDAEIMKKVIRVATLVNGGLRLVSGSGGRLFYGVKEGGSIMVNNLALLNVLEAINKLMDERTEMGKLGYEVELTLTGAGVRGNEFVLKVGQDQKLRTATKKEWIKTGFDLCAIVIPLDKNGHAIAEGTLALLNIDFNANVRIFHKEMKKLWKNSNEEHRLTKVLRERRAAKKKENEESEKRDAPANAEAEAEAPPKKKAKVLRCSLLSLPLKS